MNPGSRPPSSRSLGLAPPAALLLAASLFFPVRARCGPPRCGDSGSSAAPAAVDEHTPSFAFYFDWINSQYEGSTEAQALANLAFFRRLHDDYGMALDIYSLDVGNVDDGPYTAGTGRFIPHHCGTLENPAFKAQFPRGFAPLVEAAAAFGCRLGLWLGPDGFGDTPEEEQARSEMLVRLCRDYRFHLFKFDAVAGGLRPEKRKVFMRTLEACRKYCPDLLVLNERIDLGEAAACATTELWAGAETYIDVFSSNTCTAPHHRAGALARPLPPGLTRLIEDHGVCISSCLDFWEDDLVLQAFNRATILAPEIYGNPWFLRDEEFPRLARLCNLHRRFRAYLVRGLPLPEDPFGPFAVSRGDGTVRLITLRNLTWEPRTLALPLDERIGLTGAGAGPIEVRRFHPREHIMGRFGAGASVPVTIPSFRSCLIAVSAKGFSEVGVTGCDYEVVRDLPGKPVVLHLLAPPGTRAEVRLAAGGRRFRAAALDGRSVEGFVEGGALSVAFPGTPLKEAWHRKLAACTPCPVPEDAEALYEATCFAADSNALEVRALRRSGPSTWPEARRCRRLFLEDPMFKKRGIWDRNLFDGDFGTFFQARRPGGVLRVDLGAAVRADRILLHVKHRTDPWIEGKLHGFAEDNLAEISEDLRTWTPAGRFSGRGSCAVVKIPPGLRVRYLRVRGAPARMAEIEAYRDGAPLDRSRWRASNLLGSYADRPAVRAWSCRVVLDEIPEGARLAVAVEGRHGVEGAFAALRVEGRPVGAPDRSVSYPSNTWEYRNVDKDRGYTYYFPLDPGLAGKVVDVFVLGMKGGGADLEPLVYLTAHPPPLEQRELVLYEDPGKGNRDRGDSP